MDNKSSIKLIKDKNLLWLVVETHSRWPHSILKLLEVQIEEWAQLDNLSINLEEHHQLQLIEVHQLLKGEFDTDIVHLFK